MNPLYSPLSIHFGRLIERLHGSRSRELFLAAAGVCARIQEGHVCLDINETAGAAIEAEGEDSATVFPERNAWIAALESSPTVGRPGDRAPLILDGALLYLYRYWDYQSRLANAINRLASGAPPLAAYQASREMMDRLFPDTGEINWQRIAAAVALTRRFCIITGGPGTGKTTTVATILALFVEIYGRDTPPAIALAAPTGKAAARLLHAIARARESLPCAEDIKRQLPSQVSTIHRLLGARPGSPFFRHNARNPLDADVVVIDEASMVDLALMAKLADALKPDARLILLGDKNQLASVEAGSVLGDLCAGCAEFSRSPDALMEIRRLTGFPLPQETGKPSSPLADCVIELKKNYRTQASAAALPMLSEAVNRGDTDGAISVLESKAGAGIAWRRLPSTDRIEAELRKAVADGFTPVVTSQTPESALERFGDFRILCALRQGPWGVENINRIAERILTREKAITIDGPWYHGRTILITANDYNLGLFNGDTGICMRDPAHGNRIRAFFPSDNGLRAVLPQRLPPHETVFAMTVHKSQGSEFERTILVLSDRANPLLTRELVYTGITRARSHAEIWTGREIFAQAVAAKIARTSGLRKALWGMD